jgi:hypothetical protein
MSKKLIPKYDYEHKLEPELIEFLIRIEDLEGEERTQSRFMQMKELEWHSNVTEIQRMQNFQIEQVSEIKRKILLAKRRFMSIISEFRTKATSDDLNKVNKKVDYWKLEEFITKNEFNRLIRDKLK